MRLYKEDIAERILTHRVLQPSNDGYRFYLPEDFPAEVVGHLNQSLAPSGAKGPNAVCSEGHAIYLRKDRTSIAKKKAPSTIARAIELAIWDDWEEIKDFLGPFFTQSASLYEPSFLSPGHMPRITSW